MPRLHNLLWSSSGILLLTVLLTLPAKHQSPPGKLPCPGRQWQWVEPREAGFHPGLLDQFVKWVRGHGCVVYKGSMVRAWGRYTSRADVASAGKPVYTHLILKSVESGVLPGLDHPVSDHCPELGALNAENGNPDADITWRHLLQQVSGYGVVEPPGRAFRYSDHSVALLMDTLIMRVYECAYADADEKVLDPLFSIPLQCEDAPTMCHTRSQSGRLRISARDFARFGLLYLNSGRWTSGRVVAPEHARMVTSSPLDARIPQTTGETAEMLPGQRAIGASFNGGPSLNSSSYFWWVNGPQADGSRLLPDVPADAFAAAGHGGRIALIVIPSRDLVVCWQGGLDEMPHSRFNGGGARAVNEALKILLQAAPPPDGDQDCESGA